MGSSVLAIDTSGSFCSVALQGASGACVSRHSAGEGDHFEQLPGLVRAVCVEACVALDDLAHVRIGIGPGSFTGLRIGMSFAKGLAWSLRIPCIGVCSFRGAAVAWGLAGVTDSRITVVADARRAEVFCGEYELVSGVVSVVSQPKLVGHEDLIDRATQGGVHISPQRALEVRGLEIHPVPGVALGLLGIGAPQSGFSVADIASLEPSYIREVSAKTIEQRRMGA
jgi:tRNA threonylcarbamoyladenosine biosynthesis protein TsaB